MRRPHDLTPDLPGGLPVGLGPGDPSSQAAPPRAVVTPAAGARCVVTMESTDALPAAGRSGQPRLGGHSSEEDGVGMTWGPAPLGPADSRAEPSSPAARQTGTAGRCRSVKSLGGKGPFGFSERAGHVSTLGFKQTRHRFVNHTQATNAEGQTDCRQRWRTHTSSPSTCLSPAPGTGAAPQAPLGGPFTLLRTPSGLAGPLLTLIHPPVSVWRSDSENRWRDLRRRRPARKASAGRRS